MNSEYLIKIQLAVQNDRQLSLLTKNLEKTAKAAPKAQRAVQQATVNTKRYGNVAQNAGYQVQDFIVQVQGGQDPLRALGQQLPQLTVGMGLWGAAIGVVAAALPALIGLVFDASDATKDWDDALSDLEGSVGDIGKIANGIDLSGWVEQFQAADQASKIALQSALAYDIKLAELAQRDASRALDIPDNFNFNDLGGIGRTAEAARRTQAMRQKEFAESLGITKKQAEQLLPILQEVEASEGKNAEAADKAREMLEANTVATGEATEASRLLVQQLEAVANAQRDIDSATTTGAAPPSLVPPGVAGDPTGGEQFAGVTTLIDEMGDLNGLMADFRIQANDYIQGQREVAEGSRELAEQFAVTGEEATEGITIMEHGVKLFDQSFDTMLNGVLMGTRSMSDAFTDMAKVIVAQMLKMMAYKAIAGGLFGESMGTAFSALLENADGNAFSNGKVTPFAKGGVVNGPTVFPMANGMGLMGEAGPEAVMPLKRGSDGKLGVSGGGTNVTINNMAAGVEVNARQTDSGLTLDVVMKQVSAAINQGGNDLSRSLENAYSLGRGRSVY